MGNIRNALLALPLVVASTGAMAAADLTGSYLVTVTNSKGALDLKGLQFCVNLVQDGSLGWTQSGTASAPTLGGSGYFLIAQKSFTIVANAAVGQIVLSGAVSGQILSPASFLILSGGVPVVTGTLAAGLKTKCPAT